jgi:hypothetical protein
MTTITEDRKFAEFARGAALAAAWANEHPDLGEGVYMYPRIDLITNRVFVNVQCTSRDALTRVARVLKSEAGKLDKDYTDVAFYVCCKTPEGLDVRAWAVRDEVCEQVVVGTETVEVPDPAAPLVTIERDVVRWECTPLLDGDSS